MGAQDSITLLHVSDMQFGRNDRFGNLVSQDLDAEFDTLFQRLSDDLAVVEQQGVKPQIIVISGDLTEWARKTEFDDAFEFLVKLSERLGIPRCHVVLVPGNHDINRKHCESYFLECEAEERHPTPPFWPKWRFFNAFFQNFYKNEKNITFTIEEPWTYWELPELKLVIAGLNSTMAESHKDDSHFGWVGEGQLRWFTKRLDDARKRGWFRLESYSKR